MSPQRLYNLDRSSTEFSQQLYELLREKEYVDELQKLPEGELVQLVNYLNSIVDRLDITSNSFRKCLHVLRKICHSRKILPATYELAGVQLVPEIQTAYGGFSDIYKGTLSEAICIKKLRITTQGDQEKIRELFCKEAVVWKRLNHPNIVPLKGVRLNPLQLVSEWMPGGELREYIRLNQSANLIGLLLDAAEGLEYLHSCNVIHGDLKGPNVLVDAWGNARITDFGLAAIVRDQNSLASATDDHSYTPRWTAPEILLSNSPATRESDVFSFGMIIIEVFTGKVPFSDMAAPAVMSSIMGGKRPTQPDHSDFTEPLWALTQRCWGEAQDRPKVREVIEVLKELNAGQATKMASISVGESSTAMADSPVTTVSLKRVACSTPSKENVDRDEVAIPYGVGDSWLEPTSPSPSEDDADGHYIHGRLPGVHGNDSSAGGSMTRVLDERGLRGRLKKEKEARELEEQPKKEKRGKGTEAAANTAKENLKNEAPKPTKTATAAPVQSKFAPVSSPPIRQSSSDDEKGDYESVPSMISSNDRVNINESPSTSTFSPIEIRRGTRRLDPSKITSIRPPDSTQNDQSGVQIEVPLFQVRRNLQQADNPTDNTRKFDQSTRQNHGKTADSSTPTPRPPGSASAIKPGAPSTPQKKHGLWCRAKSACDPLHYHHQTVPSRGLGFFRHR